MSSVRRFYACNEEFLCEMNHQKLKSAEVPAKVGLVGMAERGLTNLDIVTMMPANRLFGNNRKLFL